MTALAEQVEIAPGLWINVKATTCPVCHHGTEAPMCAHPARLVEAINDLLRRTTVPRQIAQARDVLDRIRTNRAAVAASGPWDMVEAAQGHIRNTWTRRQADRYVKLTTGDSR